MYDFVREIRDKNLKEWSENWVYEFSDRYKVYEHENGSYTIETDEFGIIDYFPKKNAALIRKQNDWKRPGLKWLIENLLN